MAHDIIIRNGLIVDGLLDPAYSGDIAIDGDTISALGKVDAKGHRKLMPSAVVTRFYRSAHAYGCANWLGSSIPQHRGRVTSILMGNCGVSFAPVRPQDKELLAEMMESVEDIPRQAILSGLSWQWSSFGEYLDAIEQCKPAVNVGLGRSCRHSFLCYGSSCRRRGTNGR